MKWISMGVNVSLSLSPLLFILRHSSLETAASRQTKSRENEKRASIKDQLTWIGEMLIRITNTPTYTRHGRAFSTA